MEYPQQAWLSFMLSILAAYALSGWVLAGGRHDVDSLIGDGPVIEQGSYSYYEDKKPYNSGDTRAG